ncbi:MAG: phosphotransferase [Actinobacteria bacterium]|nr:phosphotransferase [Actinomycetota bacterium]
MDVPELVRQRASTNGAAGQRWLEALPAVVDELARRWALTLGEPFAGGTAGYVVAATDSAGRECVLKIAMPLDMDEHDTFLRSVRAHEIAAGRGCAELLAHDASVPAMLLERLGPNLAELEMTVSEILEAIAATLTTFWRPITVDDGLRTGDEQAQWLARFIVGTWEELDRPCERAVIDHALALCDRRAAAFDPNSAVLVHGDAHGWNTLDAGNGTYKFVDVEGLCSSREHDLAVAMREYNEPLVRGDTARLVRDRAEFLAERCGVDPQAVWEWGFIERVSTGLANLRDFDNDNGPMFLEVARRCR